MSLSTLNGTLDSFPLPDILRLVGVSKETGLLRVDSQGFAGRVYLVDGAIAYATTRNGDDLIDDLARFDRITSDERDAIERRAVTLEDVRGSRRQVLDMFLRHQVTEVMVRLLSMTGGDFSFAHGVMMTHPIGFRFEVGEMLQAASVREKEWEEINLSVPSVETPFRLVEKVEAPVTIDPPLWSLLAVMSQARTARGLAVALKIFEFDAAKRLAGLARTGLIVPDTSGDTPLFPLEEEAVPDVSEDEAAELLGAVLGTSVHLESSEEDEPVDEVAAPQEEGDETGADEPSDDEDLTNRWRRLRMNRVSSKLGDGEK
jgi:hypothetical protein